MRANNHGADRKLVLSTLWIFYMINILYADVLNLMGESANLSLEDKDLINSLLTPEMLLGTAVFLEMAMLMIVLSHLLKVGINRLANITVATLHTLGLIASIFIGTPTTFYIFFVVVEIVALFSIIWYAWSWREIYADDSKLQTKST